MFLLIAISSALALAMGAAVWAITTRTGTAVSQVALAIGAAACLLVVVPATSAVGYHIAKQNKITFHEYWNGVETQALVHETRCTRDGPCVHEYDCDSYWVTETYYETETYTKPDGSTGTRSVAKTRLVEKWHECPYVDTELTYSVNTTLGERTIASHWFPANPQAHLFRAHSLPDVPSGIPTEWAAAKARIAAGTPAGVTEVHDYDNYILASQDAVLNRYSDAIAEYRKAGLMPGMSTYTGDMTADKVHLVGPAPADTTKTDWQNVLGRLNGAFGSQLQGDLHLVLATDARITDPDRYAQALMAYWQSPAMGKDALSKNGVVVVIGSTDGRTATWVRAFTGMPLGNEALLTEISSDLTGQPLDPDTLLGAPTVANPGAEDPKFVNSDGLLNQALWGTHAFQRVCMGCEGTGDHGVGFTYLKSQIEPGGGAKELIVFITMILSALTWTATVYLGSGLATSRPYRPSQSDRFDKARRDRAAAWRARIRRP